MYKHAEKSHKKKNRLLANTFSQKQNGSKSTFQLVDNRPEAIQMQKFKEIANNHSQKNSLQFMNNRSEAVAERKMKKSSQASQLKDIQHKINEKTPVKAIQKTIPNEIIQRKLVFTDDKSEETSLSSIQIVLKVKYGATEKAVAYLARQAKSSKIYTFTNWQTAVNKANDYMSPAKQFLRSRRRNAKKKSKPRTKRFLYDLQSKKNYGFDDPDINIGRLKGRFRQGRGGQPFWSSKKDDYGGAVVKSDYDSLIMEVHNDKKHSEQTIARDILAWIYNGIEPKGYSKRMFRTMSTFIQLTQIIEPHKKRFAGSDKWARASFAQILHGNSSFHKEFNRKEGNFLPARAKKAGSVYGGQKSMRAFFELEKKKSDPKNWKDIGSNSIEETLDEMSDSSDEEN